MRTNESLGRGRAWRWLERIGWVAVLAYVGWTFWPQVNALFDIVPGTEQVPPFRVQTLAGEWVSMDELRGDVVLVNFWATWCPPCRIEMPGFEQVWQERRDQGFTIVGLSTDRTGERGVREYLEDRGITYPVAMAPAQVVRDFGGVSALPMSYLVDRQGRVRHVVRGYFAEIALREAVDRLLAEGR